MQTNVWAIGDVHGCSQSLDALLARPELAEDSGCRYWFTGDLVNRGRGSAAVLRRVSELGERATVVLGNHDLHLLAIAAGAIGPDPEDTLDDVLEAPDVDALLDWLRQQPLLHADAGHVLVHAGILPAWNLAEAQALATEVEQLLRAADWHRHMGKLIASCGDASWHDDLRGRRRLGTIVSALTRMRLCREGGAMALGAKAAPGEWPAGTTPWFAVAGASDEAVKVFGHWASLGLMVRENAICLDTACVTGGTLTALRLGDRKLVQVQSIG